MPKSCDANLVVVHPLTKTTTIVAATNLMIAPLCRTTQRVRATASLGRRITDDGKHRSTAISGRSAGHRVFTRLLLVVRRDARFKMDNNSIALDNRCDEGFGEPPVSSKLRDARARRAARCEQEERASVGLSLCDVTRQFDLEPAPFPWVVLS